MTGLREAFEQAAPQLVAAAWDYTGRDDAVEKLWVYVTEEERVGVVQAYYQVRGEVHTARGVAQVLPDVDGSPAAQGALFDELDDVVSDMYDARGDDEFPTRLVLSFSPAEQELNADFSYEPLQPGVPDDELVPDAQLADRWLERLRATGNESATL
ncbi:hypothetical protein GCM10025789_10080 [Tessaracoccus lubricantis]|uniref:DUF600 domain-containing protein n=1 Tax=Tessaracoccus lubricantis TaxID=545543 RepID=A0ABP9F941_9ACTN